MDNEYTVTEQAFLLCYNVDKERMTRTEHVDYLVRTAALIELYQGGQLVDTDGRVSPARGAKVTDPVLAGVFNEIGAAPGKSWKHWVRRNTKPAKQAVRARLAEQGVLTHEKKRILGLVPHSSVTMRDTRAVKKVRESVRDALRQPSSARVAPAGAALVALAAAAELGFVLDRKTRKEYKARIEQCAEIAGPAAEALKKLLRQRRAGAAAGATAAATAGS